MKNLIQKLPIQALFAIGLLLPMLVLLVIDWLDVMYNVQPPVSGWLFWVVYLTFTPLTLYLAYRKLNAKPLWACISSLLTAIVFVPLMTITMLYFHNWIGGGF